MSRVLAYRNPQVYLRLSLLLLVPLALAAALRASLGPVWPPLPRLEQGALQQRLRSLGLRPQPLASLPAWRSQGIALSELRRYQLQPGVALQLQLAQVPRRADFQLAYIARAWTPGRPAGRPVGAWVQQRCLLGNGSGVTAAELTALVDRDSRHLATVLARVLGLQPNRTWRCLHLRLEARPGIPPGRAEALWGRLLAGRSALVAAGDPQ